MKALARLWRRRPVHAVAVIAAFTLYSWWSTGQLPFTTRAYLAIAIPVVGLTLALLVARSRSGESPPPAATRPGRRALPWLILLAVAAGLEGVGLALGGRSPDVPTLSTVVDHALRWHVERSVLFCGWLAVGWWPMLRDRRTTGRR